MNTSGEGAPEVGDASVCIRCGQLLQYGEGLVLQKLESFDGLTPELVMELLRARRLVLSIPRCPA